MKAKDNIAILLFSRSAKLESCYKRWTHDKKTNFQIARHLISNTFEQLKSSPFPIFHFDEKLQIGDSFSDKFTFAFRSLFQQGFEYVIAVGNDCQDHTNDWQDISKQLIQGKAILGPDKRGGVYLIGVSKNSDIESIFSKISWSSKLVFRQLQEQLSKCFILDSKRDINTFHDIKRCNYLYSRIKALLHKWNLWPDKLLIFPIHHFSLISSRAPPIF
jgi:hypothetical protein